MPIKVRQQPVTARQKAMELSIKEVGAGKRGWGMGAAHASRSGKSVSRWSKGRFTLWSFAQSRRYGQAKIQYSYHHRFSQASRGRRRISRRVGPVRRNLISPDTFQRRRESGS